MLGKIFGAAVRRGDPETTGGGYWFRRPSAAGVVVTEDVALTYSAFWAGVKVLSEDLAKLPWRLISHDGVRRTIQVGDPLDDLLHVKANDEMTAFTWRELMASCAITWGNGYSEIERDPRGRPVALWPLYPSVTRPIRSVADGRLLYEVMQENGQPVRLEARDVFHLKGPTRDGLVGRSLLTVARESLGVALAAQKFAGDFFGNGAIPGLVIQEGDNSPEMSKEGAENMVRSFDRRHKGQAGRTGYLERGFKIESVGIPQKDAQFLETRKHQNADVARWLRVPLHKIAELDRATFNNVEQMNIDYVTDGLQPWIERLEQEANWKLALDRKTATKIYVQGLLRGDTQARGEWYTKMRDLGAFSINDILELEDRNPIGPEGDLRLVPVNMMSIQRAAQGGGTDAASAMRSVLVDGHERMIRKEQRAAERAIEKQDALDAWAEPFYTRHETQMVDALIPGALAVAQLHGIDEDWAAGAVATHVREHVEHSLRDLVAGRIDGWGARASAGADKLLGRLVAAATTQRGIEHV